MTSGRLAMILGSNAVADIRLPSSLRIVAFLLFVAFAPPLTAQPSQDVDAVLEQARSLIGEAKNDEAIGLLDQSFLRSLKSDPERLERAYLLLIEAQVYEANNKKVESLDRLYRLQEAERLVEECLSDSTLRGTRPSDTAPRAMLELFDRVHGRLFGSIEILELDPPDAAATIDGIALRREASGWIAEDIPIGERTLLIQHPKRKTYTKSLVIHAEKNSFPRFTLETKRGWRWYTAIAVPVAVVATATALAWPEPDPGELPEPPPLPSPP